MADGDEKVAPRPIRKKKKAHGHHGGAWKVAFADFMTSMFALFLVLWIISAASPEQKRYIAAYFRNPSIFDTPGSRSPLDLDGEPEVLEAPAGGDPKEAIAELAQEMTEKLDSLAKMDSGLKAAADLIHMEMTEDGLRIEIADKHDIGVFQLGSARIDHRMLQVFELLARTLGPLDNGIVLGGHTDSYAFAGVGYSNWQLSVDRANSVRTFFEARGMTDERFRAVVGYGDTRPAVPHDPYAPENRRVTLLVLQEGTELGLDRLAGEP